MATPPPQHSRFGRREAPIGLRTEWVLLIVAVTLLAYYIAPVLLLIFGGIVVAVALDGMAQETAARTPLSRGWALVLISLLLVVSLVGFIAAMAPQVSEQIDELIDTLEDAGTAAYEWLGGAGVTDVIEDSAGDADVMGMTGTVMAQIAQWGMTTLGALTSFVILLVIAGFAAADPALYRRGFVKMIPHDYRPVTEETLSAVAKALRWWFLSQLASMALLGVTVSIGLYIIGIDLWLALGVLTALMTFVPYLGPFIAAVPIVLIAFADSFNTGLIVMAFYLVVQNVEANIIVPYIQHKVVHLAPALAISAQVLLGLLFGLPGIILAAPLTVVVMIAVQKMWMEKALGEEGPK
jgi:predicted PurR-regulated permease PerM